MLVNKTPLRVSFFGGGTDYPSYFKDNPSSVLGGTINKYIYTTALPLASFSEQKFRLSYRIVEDAMSVEDISHPVIREYLKSINFRERYSFSTVSDLPGSTGLGSSSSFSVGFINLMSILQDEFVCQETLARRAIDLEQNILGENVGVQDQTHAAYGGLARYDFSLEDDQTVIERDAVQMPASRRALLDASMVLVYTSIQRHASKVLDTQETRTVQGDNDTYLSQMYDMVHQGQELLGSDGDDTAVLQQFGELLDQSWTLKKNLSNKISNSKIEEIYRTGKHLGAYGGKLLGAGGGGFILFLVDPGNIQKLQTEFGTENVIPVNFTTTGSHTQQI